MELAVNQNHPRILVNGKLTEIPMCIQVGSFAAGSNETQGFDQFGLGISQYFKLLKAMSIVFYLLTFISLPTFWIYGSGAMKNSPMATFLSFYHIGNIGQSQEQCSYTNLQTFNYSKLECKPGSMMSEILEIGLEYKETNVNNICPPYNYNTVDGIYLDLDYECDWKWNRTFNKNNQA
jgi:hypothetical protein